MSFFFKFCLSHLDHNLPKRITTFCVKYNLFATLDIYEGKQQQPKECLFDHFNKHNTTINFSRLTDTVQYHDLNMSGRIRELTSKYFLVNRKKRGEGSLSTSFFFTTTLVILASSSARPISNQCIWVWLQQGQG